MQISYSLNKRDVFFSRIVYMFQNKMLLGISLIVVCLFAFAISTSDEARKYSVGVRIIVAMVAFGFSAFQYLAILVVLYLIMTYSSKLTGVIGPHRMVIKDEGLEESTAVDQSFHRWSNSFRIKEFGSYVWIYPTDQKLFLVPKTPGRCEGDLAEFLEQLRTRIKQRNATQ
jgi:hypothetical protein